MELSDGSNRLPRCLSIVSASIIKRSAIFFAQTVIVVIIVLAVFYLVPDAEPKNNEPYKESYLIENLRGDFIGTNIAWRLPEDEPFHIHILGSNLVSDEKLKAIESAILSLDHIELDDTLIHRELVEGNKSKYYAGWRGAIESIEEKTFFEMPKKFHVHAINATDGHVIIRLTNLKDPDSINANTRSVVDKDSNRILQSTITIYEADSTSAEGLAIIMRHEFGHALGLAHSTDPDDLMYQKIQTVYPYISDCDIEALQNLYDGKQNGTICKK